MIIRWIWDRVLRLIEHLFVFLLKVDDGWVLKEVVKSSLEVARVVLSPSMPIQPTVVEFTTDEKTDSGKVILGNSITLSPGTVTIDVHEDRLLVHCLTDQSAQGLRSGEAARQVARLGLD